MCWPGLIVPKAQGSAGRLWAAVCLQEKVAADKREKSTFRGLASAIEDRMDYAEKVCSADAHCHNQCKLKITTLTGARASGAESAADTKSSGPRERNRKTFSRSARRCGRRHVGRLRGAQRRTADGGGRSADRVEFKEPFNTLQTGVMWAHFFDRLGYRLVVTPSTNSEISSSGIESMTRRLATRSRCRTAM